ncbi:MAG TPA: hypothetical protein VFL86_26320 [Burkholderiaceae bacterium]|nr:hypothetical protein [Burkholderiaceae bacterium]
MDLRPVAPFYRVRFDDGRSLDYSGDADAMRRQVARLTLADVVVSNADSAWTYRHLVPAGHRRRWTDRRIEQARYSMSLFVWYFGTRRQYPGVPPPTSWCWARATASG